MRWCKKCVESDLRPTVVFDDEGVCQPCRYAEMPPESIDWDLRNRQLDGVIRWAKEHNVSGYDCIIGVSGGKDSLRQALFAREIGLRPLLVCCTYPPEQQTDRGVDNLANLISLGFDTVMISPAPQTSKALVRNTFIKFGNYGKATELALFASLPRMAIGYQIPLILLGENPAIAWGTEVGSRDYDGNKMKYMNTLQGGDPQPIMTPDMQLKDVYWYRYPSDQEMERAKLRIVYIGYFLNDFNDQTNSRVAIEHGMRVREGEDAKPENIGSIYNYYALDEDFVHVNQMLKHMKFGIGQAAEQICGAIRSGLITRAEGVELMKKYDGKCSPKFIKAFADYIGMTVEEFWEVAERFRNHDIWEKDASGEWKLKYEIA